MPLSAEEIIGLADIASISVVKALALGLLCHACGDSFYKLMSLGQSSTLIIFVIEKVRRLNGCPFIVAYPHCSYCIVPGKHILTII